MRILDVVIATNSAAEALKQATTLLKSGEDNILLQDQGNKIFKASVIHADAQLEVVLSLDRMEAVVREYLPPRGDGLPLTLEKIGAVLASAGVRGAPQPTLANELLALIQKAQSLTGRVVARGQPPGHGADGRIEFCFDTGVSGGKIEANGSVDFHERNFVKSVEQNALLARLILPRPGVPGKDLEGNTLPASDGAPATIAPGQNVVLSADKTQLRAAVCGTVVISRNTIAVQNVLELRKDVDYSTGNIHLKSGGSVNIRGSIRSGFSVTSRGGIAVGESIEDAVVEAGGDLTVRFGITMAGTGFIRARGKVQAKFTQNARIEAGGDVIIASGIMHSQITCGGSVIAVGGKGSIVGGTVHCQGNVEAKEIGSETYIPTRIVIGGAGGLLQELQAEAAQLGELQRSLEVAVGQQREPEKLKRLSSRQQQILLDKLQQLSSVQQRLVLLNAEIEKAELQMKEHKSSLVIVHKIIHPGVTLSLGGCIQVIQQTMKASQFFYDPETRAIQLVKP